MEDELKQLLLKDLSARLPYKLKGKVEHDWFFEPLEPYDATLTTQVYASFLNDKYDFKPYLRPMSSMTEEELKEFESFDNIFNHDPVGLVDWLNAKMFDYRGLIDNGIALPAPEGMYNLKEK